MNDATHFTLIKLHDHRYKSARDALKFNILLILLAVRFTTFWHRHRIMTHFWPPAVHRAFELGISHCHLHLIENSDGGFLCGWLLLSVKHWRHWKLAFHLNFLQQTPQFALYRALSRLLQVSRIKLTSILFSFTFFLFLLPSFATDCLPFWVRSDVLERLRHFLPILCSPFSLCTVLCCWIRTGPKLYFLEPDNSWLVLMAVTALTLLVQISALTFHWRCLVLHAMQRCLLTNMFPTLFGLAPFTPGRRITSGRFYHRGSYAIIGAKLD